MIANQQLQRLRNENNLLRAENQQISEQFQLKAVAFSEKKVQLLQMREEVDQLSTQLFQEHRQVEGLTETISTLEKNNKEKSDELCFRRK